VPSFAAVLKKSITADLDVVMGKYTKEVQPAVARAVAGKIYPCIMYLCDAAAAAKEEADRKAKKTPRFAIESLFYCCLLGK
jgi:homoserine acetyltransferase